ncbi:uncharacterized protein CLUP02_16670 [Colletotrichum lupini]|uniref:Uncharacterized protein n=1 Tax=Colletotrichum lupini TaxID=145971 RepID=A0A9Q8TAK4_9PEZI|nr:uncharacterized protein CLUP02_16670 [Colletotrichum lupini]UQC91136.1 hypothetical protein CLUP02_16670 [Colletotrichum lupini]
MPPTYKGRKANSGPNVPAIASPPAERFSTHQLKVIDVCLRQTGFDFRGFACGPVAEAEWDALKLLHLDFALPTADPSLTMTASRLAAIIHAAAQCLESSDYTTRDAAFWKEVKKLLSDDSTFQSAPIFDFVKFDNILYRFYSAWVSFRDKNPGMSRTLIQEPYTTSAESKAASSKDELLAATDEYIRQTVRGKKNSIALARRHFKAGYRAHFKSELEETYSEAYDKGKREGESEYKIKLKEMKAKIRKEEADLFALNRVTMDRNRQVGQENKSITKEVEELQAENSELRRLNKELSDLCEASQQRFAMNRSGGSTEKRSNGFAFGEVVDLLD